MSRSIVRRLCHPFCLVLFATAACGTGYEPEGPSARGKADTPTKAACGEARQALERIRNTAVQRSLVDVDKTFVTAVETHARCIVRERVDRVLVRSFGAAEKLFVEVVATLVNSDTRRVVEVALTTLAETMPTTDAKKLSQNVSELLSRIDAELCQHGMLEGCGDRTYASWEEIAEYHAKILADNQPDLRFGDKGFKKALAKITSEFVGGNTVSKLYTYGPEARDLRLELIREAEKSIYLMTWAIYDDKTGTAVTDALIDKHEALGSRIKVLVDGQTAKRKHHRENVARLEQAGIEVVRLSGTGDRIGDGNHRKLFIVDQQIVIAGGRNIGDDYFNAQGEDGGWRDNEMMIRGPALAQAVELFADIWNSAEVDEDKPKTPVKANHLVVDEVGDVVLTFTDQTPAKVDIDDAIPPVTMSILKAIQGAKVRIDIANAYFILTPDIEAALVAAVDRGVEVNILTNSSTSIDQPMIARPILTSAQRMLEAGANIYLEQGTATLHSKFMVVDDVYAWVGSYNIHPRSYRYEGELAVQVLQDRPEQDSFVDDVAKAFKRDKEMATHATTVEKLQIPEESAMGVVLDRFFFDAL